MLEQYFQAVQQHDLSGFLSFFLDDEAFTIVEDAETYDWQSFVAFAEGFFQAVPVIAFELERCAVDPIALDSAVVTGVFRGMGQMTSGEPLAIRNAFTFVLVKREERWRIKHAHESSLPA